MEALGGFDGNRLSDTVDMASGMGCMVENNNYVDMDLHLLAVAEQFEIVIDCRYHRCRLDTLG